MNIQKSCGYGVPQTRTSQKKKNKYIYNVFWSNLVIAVLAFDPLTGCSKEIAGSAWTNQHFRVRSNTLFSLTDGYAFAKIGSQQKPKNKTMKKDLKKTIDTNKGRFILYI